MIKANNAQFLYESRGIAGISSLSFEIRANEITSIIGPSGAGKTTLLNLITQKMALNSGEIKIETPQDSISYVNQFPTLDEEKTLFQNLINLSNQQHQNEMRDTLELLELTNEIDLPVKALSGGQKQRAIIAKALVPLPKVLLLDEPFANIHDFLKFDLLNFLIPKLKEMNVTTLWVTHQIKDALAFSDRIMLMNFGNIVQFDTPEVIYRKPNGLFAGNFLGSINAWTLSKTEKFKNSFLNQSFEIPFKETKYETFCLIRPEHIIPSKTGLQVKEIASFYHGAFWENHGTLDNGEQIIFHSNEKPEELSSVSIDWKKAHFLDGIS